MAKKVEKVEVVETKTEEVVELKEEPKVEAKKDDGLIEVVATNVYKKHGIKDNQLGYVPEEGESFKVTKERLKVLVENRWNEPLVTIKK